MSDNTGQGGFVFTTDDYSDSDSFGSNGDYDMDDEQWIDMDTVESDVHEQGPLTHAPVVNTRGAVPAAAQATPASQVAPVNTATPASQVAPVTTATPASQVAPVTTATPAPPAASNVTPLHHQASPVAAPTPASSIAPPLRRQVPQAAAPIVPRPEFVPINRTPEQLDVINFLTEPQMKLWNDFFNVGPINNEDVYYSHYGVFVAFRQLWFRGWITITGMPGIGKTAMAERLSVMVVQRPTRKFDRETYYVKSPYADTDEWKYTMMPEDRTELYEVVYVNSPEDWRRKVNKDKHQVIILDDIFGPASYTLSKIETWTPYLQEIMAFTIKNKPKSLVILTVQKFQVEKLHPRIRRLPFFQDKLMVDLESRIHSVDDYPRMTLLENICGKDKHGLSSHEMSEARSPNNKSFPLSCRLLGGVKSFHMEGPKFFRSPDRSLDTVIQKVFNFHKIFHYTLACATFFDGILELDKEHFENYSETEQNVFQKLRTILEVPDDVGLDKIRHACTLLNGVFLLPTRLHCWKFSHERIYFCVADALNRKIPKALIELCSLDFVVQRLRTANYYGGNLESCVNVWSKDYNELCQRFTFEMLKGNVRLLASHPSLSDSKFSESWIKFMAEMGSLLPVVQQRGDYNRSVFFWTAYYGHEQMWQHLLKHEDLEDIRQEEWFKEELDLALYAACTGATMNYGKLVKLLLDNGASLTARETLPEEDQIILYGEEVTEVALKWKGSLLHIAALYGTFETINSLVEKGADVNEKTEDGFTALHRAATNPEDGAVKALVKHKADLKAVSKSGSRPLHEAVRCGIETVTRYLHVQGDKIQDDRKMNDNKSMLSVAVAHGYEDLTRTTMAGMDSKLSIGGRDNWPPLHTACAMCNETLVKTLLDRGASVNEQGCGGWTPLHFACVFYNMNIVSMLLEKNIDVNIMSYYKKTPLHLAAENGYFNLCNLLLDHGADPEKITNDCYLPVGLAAASGHVEIVRMLIDEGLDLPVEPPEDRRSVHDMMMFGLMRDHRMRNMFK